jgi:hypothetical protein
MRGNPMSKDFLFLFISEPAEECHTMLYYTPWQPRDRRSIVAFLIRAQSINEFFPSFKVIIRTVIDKIRSKS